MKDTLKEEFIYKVKIVFCRTPRSRKVREKKCVKRIERTQEKVVSHAEETVNLMRNWLEDIKTHGNEDVIEIEKGADILNDLGTLIDLLLQANASVEKCCGIKLLMMETVNELQRRSIAANATKNFFAFLKTQCKEKDKWYWFDKGKTFLQFIDKEDGLQKLLIQVASCGKDVRIGNYKN